MAEGSSNGTHSLREIIRAVEANRQMVTVYNFNGADRVLTVLNRFFENQSVTLRRRSTTDGIPKNFVVLHDDEEFIAADPLPEVYDAVTGTSRIRTPGSLGGMQYPDVIRQMDKTVFESYAKPTMIGISRGIEQFAWRQADGELHAGFQRFSLFDDQAKIYDSLVDRGVDVHVYGERDTDIFADNITLHPSREREITNSWFVVFDPPDGERRALLAWERVPDDFHGFWTRRDDLVDAILNRLRTSFPTES